jgi:hypothetical protein
VILKVSESIKKKEKKCIPVSQDAFASRTPFVIAGCYIGGMVTWQLVEVRVSVGGYA